MNDSTKVEEIIFNKDLTQCTLVAEKSTKVIAAS